MSVPVIEIDPLWGSQWKAAGQRMAAVDFGSWEPPADERAEVMRLASQLPADWTIRCSTGQTSTGLFLLVIEEGDGSEHATRLFDPRLDGVAEFLKKVVRIEGRP